jgi:hypothetical protein
MSNERLAGVLLIIGFGLVVIGSVVGPPGLYQEPELDARLEIITANPGNWLASNGAWALAVLVTAAGLLVFSVSLRDTDAGTLGLVAGAAIVLGAISFTIQLYLRQISPGENYERTTLFTLGFVWLTLIALLAYGVVFLRARYPKWLASLFIGVPILLVALAIFLGSRFYFNFPPQAFYLLTLLAGIVFVRRGRAPLTSEIPGYEA